MTTERTVPISRLHAVEARAMRRLSLIRDMIKVLREAPVDGVSALILRAETLEAGFSVGGGLTTTGLLAAVERFLEDHEPPTSPDPETGEATYDCCGAEVARGHVPSCLFWGLRIAVIRERARLGLKGR